MLPWRRLTQRREAGGQAPKEKGRIIDRDGNADRTGLLRRHMREQQELVDRALTVHAKPSRAAAGKAPAKAAKKPSRKGRGKAA